MRDQLGLCVSEHGRADRLQRLRDALIIRVARRGGGCVTRTTIELLHYWCRVPETPEVGLRLTFGIESRNLASITELVFNFQPSVFKLFASLTHMPRNKAVHEAPFSEAGALLPDSDLEQLVGSTCS